jgi:hypothetical protein
MVYREHGRDGCVALRTTETRRDNGSNGGGDNKGCGGCPVRGAWLGGAWCVVVRRAVI